MVCGVRTFFPRWAYSFVAAALLGAVLLPARETLLDYNHAQTTIGVGVSFGDGKR